MSSREEENNQKQVPADANVGWEELKSDKGNNYRIKASNYDIAAKPTDEEANSVAANGPSFDAVPVHWTVGSSGSPSEEVQDKTAITWYKLDKSEWWSPWQYKLTFNTKDTYNYRFGDETNDQYQVNVWQNAGSHSVEYKSAKPTITAIWGN